MNTILNLLVFVAVAGCVSCQAMSNETKIYAFYIGTNQDGFENNSVASASGEDIAGGIFLYLNGNPVAYYGGYGKMVQVNQWLKKDENSFTLKGVSSKPLYVKVVKYDLNGKDFKVLAKEYVKSGNMKFTGKFKADVDYVLPFFDNSIPKDSKNVEKDIKREVLHIKTNIENRDSVQLFDQLLSGPAFWQPIAYRINWSEINQTLENRIMEQYVNGDKKIVDFNVSNLNIILGKNSAYVYSGINKDVSIPRAYLFKLMDKNETIDIPPAKFVKLEDKWLLWE